MFGYYSKETNHYLYDYKLVNFPQPIRIRLRWLTFYFNNSVPQSVLIITITYNSSHEGTCRCNISLGHVPATCSCLCKCCDFVPATCSRYTSLLHVPQCVIHLLLSLLHAAATCPCYMTLRVCPNIKAAAARSASFLSC